MEYFTKGVTIIQIVIGMYGSYMIIHGLTIIGAAFKDKTGPQYGQGIGTLFGGVVIVAASLLLGFFAQQGVSQLSGIVSMIDIMHSAGNGIL